MKGFGVLGHISSRNGGQIKALMLFRIIFHVKAFQFHELLEAKLAQGDPLS